MAINGKAVYDALLAEQMSDLQFGKIPKTLDIILGDAKTKLRNNDSQETALEYIAVAKTVSDAFTTAYLSTSNPDYIEQLEAYAAQFQIEAKRSNHLGQRATNLGWVLANNLARIKEVYSDSEFVSGDDLRIQRAIVEFYGIAGNTPKMLEAGRIYGLHGFATPDNNSFSIKWSDPGNKIQ